MVEECRQGLWTCHGEDVQTICWSLWLVDFPIEPIIAGQFFLWFMMLRPCPHDFPKHVHAAYHVVAGPFFSLVTLIFWHQLCWQRWKWLGHCSPELDLRLTVMALRWWHNWAQEELYKSCGEVWYQHAIRRWRIPCCKLWRASGVQRYQRASRLTCRRSTRILIPTSERSDDD